MQNNQKKNRLVLVLISIIIILICGIGYIFINKSNKSVLNENKKALSTTITTKTTNNIIFNQGNIEIKEIKVDSNNKEVYLNNKKILNLDSNFKEIGHITLFEDDYVYFNYEDPVGVIDKYIFNKDGEEMFRNISHLPRILHISNNNNILKIEYTSLVSEGYCNKDVHYQQNENVYETYEIEYLGNNRFNNPKLVFSQTLEEYEKEIGHECIID